MPPGTSAHATVYLYVQRTNRFLEYKFVLSPLQTNLPTPPALLPSKTPSHSQNTRNMASAELGLKRTLTDILEDELYHLNNKNSGVYSSHYQYPAANKAYMAHQNPAPVSNNSYSATWSGNNAQPEDDAAIVTIDPEKLNFIPENDNYTSAPSLLPGKRDTPFHNIQQQYSLSMFNKYADPSLTTTSAETRRNRRSNSNNSTTSTSGSMSPLPKTVNMRNILSIPNPFMAQQSGAAPAASTTNTQTQTNIPQGTEHDHVGVRITVDTPHIQEMNDAYLYYEGDAAGFVPKAEYALQRNHASLHNENAKLIFDNEFSDDDDFDDDSQEYDVEEEQFIAGTGLDMQQQPSKNNVPEKKETVQQPQPAAKATNTYSFVDTDIDLDATEKLIISDQMTMNLRLNAEEEALLDADDVFYGKSLGNMVVSNEEIQELNRSKSISLKSRPKIQGLTPSTHTAGNKLRKPLTSLNSNVATTGTSAQGGGGSNSASKGKEPSRKHKTYLGSTDLNEEGDGEIFTCRLVNLITKEPCSAQFSRSYDLTRHQNTIHAKKKIVFRCSECMKQFGTEGYEKTFSRLDALTRHIKSKHEALSAEERQRVTKYAKENIGYAAA